MLIALHMSKNDNHALYTVFTYALSEGLRMSCVLEQIIQK